MLILYGILGLVVGSFLNTVIDRVPARASFWTPPSHCPRCERKLSPAELVPVVSYIALRGRCRTCGVRIPARTLWVEIATGALFAFLWWSFGPSLRLLLNTVYFSILLAILVIDLEHKLVPNVIVLPATLLALVATPLQLIITPPIYANYGFLALFSRGNNALPLPTLSMISQLIGGVVAFGIFFLVWIISPKGMGAGDVKLAGFVGLITGFPGALAAVFGSFIMGGVVALVLLATGKATRKTAIPFAPFMVIAAFLVMLYGDPLLHWYLGQWLSR
jgi:leader peptidase (prepilin peptidase)/N-methyltransferase